MAILSIKCSSLVGLYPALLLSLLQQTLTDWIDVVNKDHHRHFDPLYVIHSLVAYCKYAQSYLMRWILSSLRGHFEHDYERIYLRFPHGWRTFLVAYLLGHGMWVVVPVSINSTIWILAVGWDRNWVAITCVCYGNFCKRMLSIHKNAGVDDDTDGYAKRIARGDNRWPIDIVCACGWAGVYSSGHRLWAGCSQIHWNLPAERCAAKGNELEHPYQDFFSTPTPDQ